MQLNKAVQWTWHWKDAFLDQRSRDELLFGRLNGANDTSADDVDREKNNEDKEEEDDRSSLPWPRLGRQQRAITVLTIICLLLLTTTIVFWQAKRPLAPGTSAYEGPYHCGNSTPEARALGCEFDILSYSWTPRACYERGTALEFRNWLHREDRRFGAFPFFFDEKGIEHVPDEFALSESHGRTIYTTQEEHLGHCTFLMRRWHRLANQHERSNHINHRFGKYIHTKHCTNRILKALANPNVLNEQTLNSRFGVTFEKC